MSAAKSFHNWTGWAAVGAIFTVVSAIVGLTMLAIDIHQRFSENPSNNNPEINIISTAPRYIRPDIAELAKVGVYLTHDEQHLNAVRVDKFDITYNGKSSIHPADFVIPLAVSVPAPVEIIGIATDKSKVGGLMGEADFTWTKHDPTQMIATPLQLNPGDSSHIIVVSTAPKENLLLDQNLPALTWSGKIDGGRIKTETDEELISSVTGMMVIHQGAEIYLLLGVGFILTGLLIGLSRSSITNFTWSYVLIFAAFATLGFSTAEVIVDLLTPHPYSVQRLLSAVVLLLYAAACGWLAYRAKCMGNSSTKAIKGSIIGKVGGKWNLTSWGGSPPDKRFFVFLRENGVLIPSDNRKESMTWKQDGNAVTLYIPPGTEHLVLANDAKTMTGKDSMGRAITYEFAGD
jgi:hypothetical protein